ncbi:MAG: response regulator [Deltaproteobacteria bacterium]|nr:MAG: response regulator [Deltaproteobacteria bacterium]
MPAELDPEKLERMFLNLLSNAFKFAPSGGTVRCFVAADSERATVHVLDSGPGVRPELREAIFERFRQGEEGAGRRFGGTGLGLSIVKEFVELHGGTIAVGDAPGGGAAFTVSLPLKAPPGIEVRRAAPEDADVQAIARQALEELRAPLDQAVPSATGRGLVLIVEDNPEMMRFIAATLGDEYRIATARDGGEGLEQALALGPDLVLSDVMMPGVSGDELVRTMRERAELDAVPIVLLTAKADDELRVKLLRDGAQDYVMKPFSAEELRARVANLISLKRTREVLQQELASQLRDLELLASEVTFRKRELEHTLEAMRVARAQAERASQAKSDFLRLVSHELRTPLTAIQTYLYVLERDAGKTLAAGQRDIVRRISASSVRLLGLIESLLEYAHIETGRLVVQRERVDVPALVQEVVSEMAPQAAEKGLELRVAPAGPLPAVESDPRLIRLIVANLVGNAIKFTMRGAVDLSCSHQGDVHRLSVRDSGPGIPPDIHTHIFEPFEQLEPVHQKHTPGVGLGLALVREMVQALGGHVELESRVGAGSTFTVILPAHDAHAAVDQERGQG